MHEDPTLAGKLAKTFGVTEDDVKRRVAELVESNPMLGHREVVVWELCIRKSPPCRHEPSSKRACALKKEGIECHPEIMIPLAGYKAEVDNQTAVIKETAAKVFDEQGVSVDFMTGTMIEIPRAALTAGEIADTAGILQLRYQRPDSDGIGNQPGRL